MGRHASSTTDVACFTGLSRPSRTLGAVDPDKPRPHMAQRMVCDFGMSEKVGPVAYERPEGLRWLPSSPGLTRQAMSDQSAQLIDQEVKALLDRCMARARAVLEPRVDLLRSLAQELKTKEVMTGDEVRARLAPSADGRVTIIGAAG